MLDFRPEVEIWRFRACAVNASSCCFLATARLSCTGDVCGVNTEINNLLARFKKKTTRGSIEKISDFISRRDLRNDISLVL